MPDQEPHGEEFVPEDDAIIGRAFRWSLAAFGTIAVIVIAVVLLRSTDEVAEVTFERDVTSPVDQLDQRRAEMPQVQFTDVTAEAGIEFVHYSGAAGDKLLPETMGGGVAFFDVDGDGTADLFLVNGMDWPENRSEERRPTSALYRNDGTGRFTDVSAEYGLDVEMMGMGVAVGDYDNDGLLDLYITAVGPNRLMKNGDGQFTDVTEAANAAGRPAAWSTSAGFFDYDNDGAMDLWVCNYIEWTRDIDIALNFTLNGTDRAYGPPNLYRGADSTLLRNQGNGTFTDVSAEAGILVANPALGQPMGKALALVFHDVDDSGFLDVFIANDTVQNFLFRNLGDGRFEEVGTRTGVAFDPMGSATGAMGIDAADYANDGSIGVGIGNFANESTSFFVQRAGRTWQFADIAGAEGIGSPSRLKLTFGLFFFDYDLDGRLDLLQANGHLEDGINQIQPSQHYEQPAQLFWNCGPESRSCYAAVPESQLGDLARPIVGRGAAYADIDGDGDLDVVLTQIGARPLLLRNDQALGHHWLRVRLEGTGGNTAAIGATVELKAGDVTQRRTVMPTRSYLSQVERTVTFGLGTVNRVDQLEIRWPDGTRQRIDVAEVDQVLVIRQPVSG